MVEWSKIHTGTDGLIAQKPQPELTQDRSYYHRYMHTTRLTWYTTLLPSRISINQDKKAIGCRNESAQTD